MAKDPICGMTVDEAMALQAERDGETFYFWERALSEEISRIHSAAGCA